MENKKNVKQNFLQKDFKTSTLEKKNEKREKKEEKNRRKNPICY